MHDKLFNQVSKLNILHLMRAGSSDTDEFLCVNFNVLLIIPRNVQINIK